MPHFLRRISLGGLAGVMALSLFVSAFFVSAPAYAAEDETIDQTVEKWLMYRGMRACLEHGLNSKDDLSWSDVVAGKWGVAGDKDGFGYVGPSLDGADDNDGTVSCDTRKIWTEGAKLYGFNDAGELMCAINRGLEKAGDGSRVTPNNSENCEKSSAFEVIKNGDWQPALTEALSEKVSRPNFHINDNKYSGAMKYIIGARSLEVFCGKGKSLASGIDDRTNDDGAVSVHLVTIDADGEVKIEKSKTYRLSGDRDNQDDKVDDVYYNPGGNSNEAQDLRCHEMAKMTRDNATAYAEWAQSHKELFKEAVEETSSTPPAATETTSCAIDGIGWIVCPIMSFIGKMNDAAFGFLESMLGIRPNMITHEATQNAWSAFRDLANVAFVIAFMVIVYSQLTSSGISNYGVKKILPRVVVAAVLVNLSFIICALAVDVSNIVGSSVYTLLKDSIDVKGAIDTTTWEDSLGKILAGAATGIGVILLVVAVFMSPMVLLAFGLIILILVARQAFVILLIVVSPLAFVAYLLPNTEDWFKKWWKALLTTLMVYPVIGVVFGASTLASQVLTSVAQGGGEDEQLLMLIALGILAVPLFAVPAVLKSSLSAAGSVGAKISSFADRTDKSTKDRAKARLKESAAGQYMSYRSEQARVRRALTRGGIGAEGSNKNPLNWKRNTTAAVMGRVNSGQMSGAFGDQLGARGASIEDEQWGKTVGMHKNLYSREGMTDTQLLADMRNTRLSTEKRAAAAGMVMSNGSRASQIEALRTASALAQSGDGAIGGIQKQMSGDMGQRRPFGLADSQAAALRTGTYSGDIDADTQTRAVEKLAAAGVPDLDPDDLGLIASQVQNGQITGENLSRLRSTIQTAYGDERINTRIKGQARAQLDGIVGSNAVVDPVAAREQADVQNVLYTREQSNPSNTRPPSGPPPAS